MGLLPQVPCDCAVCQGVPAHKDPRTREVWLVSECDAPVLGSSGGESAAVRICAGRSEDGSVRFTVDVCARHDAGVSSGYLEELLGARRYRVSHREVVRADQEGIGLSRGERRERYSASNGRTIGLSTVSPSGGVSHPGNEPSGAPCRCRPTLDTAGDVCTCGQETTQRLYEGASGGSAHHNDIEPTGQKSTRWDCYCTSCEFGDACPYPEAT